MNWSDEIEINVEGMEFPVYFKVSEGKLSRTEDATLCALLQPYMLQKKDLSLAGPVSPKLLESSKQIQDIFNYWVPPTEKINLTVDKVGATEFPGERGVAAFFTGGVDSFYTLNKHMDEIDALIFVHGFDTLVEDIEGREVRASNLREAAKKFGKPLIEIETNLRNYSGLHANWEMYHGGALACIGHLLAPSYKKVYIASTNSYSSMHPWGSHVFLDPLWSSESVEFIHDGAEAHRTAKVEVVSQNDIAMEHLHVCYADGAPTNCCRCEKCIRTLITLRAVGKKGPYPTFKEGLDFRRAKMMQTTPTALVYRGILAHMGHENIDDPELEKLLKVIVSRRYNRGIWVPIRYLYRKFLSPKKDRGHGPKYHFPTPPPQFKS